MKRLFFFTACLSMFLVSCSDKNIQLPDRFSSTLHPVINGTRVTGNDRLSTVVLYIDIYGQKDNFCTGTLITPNYVLTAGHCIGKCNNDDMTDYFPYMRVGIGQDMDHIKKSYRVAELIEAPGFFCTDEHIANDIALVRLEQDVSPDVAVPSLIIPPELALSADEVDRNEIYATSVGFGMTDANDENSSGRKFETTRWIAAYCPLEGKQSQECYNQWMASSGFLVMYDEHSNVCSGDSGGPTFLKRGSDEFVIGVSSWVSGIDCYGTSAMTDVNSYRSFIEANVPNLPSPKREICDNGVDDNNDGRIDCDDPYCYGLNECAENCGDGIDNNRNGLVDCEELIWCRDSIRCVPENCTNDLDDNADGLTDCADPQCAGTLYCIPEDCTNGLDDNANGLIDCNDPQCFGTPVCLPENCTNGVDDNGDGLKDCDDPKCKTDASCAVSSVEICGNFIDDDGNGLVDCEDPACLGMASCSKPVQRLEICGNDIDDDGNGLVDCADPACLGTPFCSGPAPSSEICGNDVDDDGNGLVDCDDPACGSLLECVSKESSDASDCSMTKGPQPSAPLFVLFCLPLVLAFRRRKD